VYEYRCDSCRAEFSKLVRRIGGADELSPRCPHCADSAKRLLSRFAYHRSLAMQLEQLDPAIERELDYVDNAKKEPLHGFDPGSPVT